VLVTQRDGARWSTASAYLRPALARSNLVVVTGAQAMHVLFEGRRAVGVEYECDGRVERASAGEVILGGGVINSPHLLLLSGIGPAAELERHGIAVVHDLPGVGRNLQDHTEVALGLTVNGLLSPPALESAVNALRYAISRQGRLTSGLAEAAAYVATDPALTAPDLELLLVVPRPRPLYPTARWAAARARELARTALGRRRGGDRRLLLLGAVVIQPRSVGTLRLASADPRAPVHIDPSYLSESDDVRVLVDGVRLARRIVATSPLAERVVREVEPGPDVQDDDELATYARGAAGSLAHLAGTCKMGIDDLAVVDPELRVHGIDNLRVVDASVMPRVPRGHLNAPTVMIAERAAELILQVSSSAQRGARDG
jgi:choline dehydrogenase